MVTPHRMEKTKKSIYRPYARRAGEEAVLIPHGAGSAAAAELIGEGLRHGDIDDRMARSTFAVVGSEGLTIEETNSVGLKSQN